MKEPCFRTFLPQLLSKVTIYVQNPKHKNPVSLIKKTIFVCLWEFSSMLTLKWRVIWQEQQQPKKKEFLMGPSEMSGLSVFPPMLSVGI